MGLIDVLKNQFLDVIEFESQNTKLIVSKYNRESGNNELKQGSKVIVRESQCAIFIKCGNIADVLKPGTYTLDTNNMPLLSTLSAFPYLFISPIITDLYFINTRQFIDNKWSTRNPIMKRDIEMNMVRIRSFGKFSFKIVDPKQFMKEIFGTKGIVMSFDIATYLSSMLTEAFATIIGESQSSVLDLACEYRKISVAIQTKFNEQINIIGIEFSDVIIENISLPDEVEKLIDEQSGIGMAKRDMDSFVHYQTARAMRDAAKQEGGLAGLGAGMALGNTMAQNIQDVSNETKQTKSKTEKLRELKGLLDDQILTQEEFDIEKKTILKQ